MLKRARVFFRDLSKPLIRDLREAPKVVLLLASIIALSVFFSLERKANQKIKLGEQVRIELLEAGESDSALTAERLIVKFGFTKEEALDAVGHEPIN